MKLKRTAAAVVAAVMAFTAVATPLGDNIPALEGAFSAGAYYSVKDSFYPVTLTGDGAKDMVNVAVAQNGRKDDDTGWYPSSEAWCADKLSHESISDRNSEINIVYNTVCTFHKSE